MVKDILVYGSRDLGRVVKSIVEQSGFRFAGFIDDYSQGDEILGPYARVKEKYPPDAYKIAMAIGFNYLEARWAVYQKLIEDGYEFPPLIHPNAYVRDRTAVEQGAIVMARAIVDTNTRIGELSVLSPGAVVNYGGRVGSNTFLSSNSVISGHSTIEMNCFVGAGAVIMDHVTVPEGSFIKANEVFYSGKADIADKRYAKEQAPNKVVVIQSNYIPWKGYFDIIHEADVFFFYDDVQYTKNDWRNRNKIKTPGGTKWLTVPVGFNLGDLISDIKLEDNDWQKKHWMTLEQFYSQAPHFDLYCEFFKEVYLEMKWDKLSDLNQFLIKTISQRFLGMDTEFRDSRELNPIGKKADRVMDLLKKAGADIYISGPSAKNYIAEDTFKEARIKLEYKDYSGYPEYSQFHPPFNHYVTILDLLFHTGPEAPYYIWGWREEKMPPCMDS